MNDCVFVHLYYVNSCSYIYYQRLNNVYAHTAPYFVPQHISTFVFITTFGFIDSNSCYGDELYAVVIPLETQLTEIITPFSLSLILQKWNIAVVLPGPFCYQISTLQDIYIYYAVKAHSIVFGDTIASNLSGTVVLFPAQTRV